MLKKLLLATSMLVAVPAFAQDKPAAGTTPAQEQSATQNQTDPAAPTPADPAATAQTAPQANPAPATQAAQPTPSQPAAQAAAQPAVTQDQVAQAVNRDFGNYDKDSNGTLSQAEFGAWIGTLRKASEPSFQPGTADANTWVGQAFAASDTDRNKSIDKAELTAFLTPKAS